MNSKVGGFDKIAIFYDYLARLVFGNAIHDVQVCFLEEVSTPAKVLILGGGTGWILEHLLQLKPECEVWYIEASEKMIELSKANVMIVDAVHFIHGTENSIPPGIKFDAVITNFYLDLFTEAYLGPVLKNIQKKMKVDALWMAADFIDTKKWQHTILLKIMYRFFQITCGITATRLPDWNQCLVKSGLVKLKFNRFRNEFIETAVYQYPG